MSRWQEFSRSTLIFGIAIFLASIFADIMLALVKTPQAHGLPIIKIWQLNPLQLIIYGAINLANGLFLSALFSLFLMVVPQPSHNQNLEDQPETPTA